MVTNKNERCYYMLDHGKRVNHGNDLGPVLVCVWEKAMIVICDTYSTWKVNMGTFYVKIMNHCAENETIQDFRTIRRRNKNSIKKW